MMSGAHVERVRTTDIAIIGAGPAGLSAAITLARYGQPSVIIDENPTIGGQIFRQPQKRQLEHDDVAKTPHDPGALRKAALFAELERAGDAITLWLSAQVVGVLGAQDQPRLAVLDDTGLVELEASQMVVSCGCYERAQPFPGWTLPGVMSVGGAQCLVKSGQVKPGDRIVLAGTGPLLLVAAQQLHHSGVEVAGVMEAGRRWDLARATLDAAVRPALLWDGLRYSRYLSKHGIPLQYGWGIVAARGEGELSSVVVAPYDDQWRPVRERAVDIAADCLGVGYGYVPRVQLLQMLGCVHQYRQFTGGPGPVTDDWQRTSRSRVYAAGDVAGVYGAGAAMLQGQLAALACLVDTDRLTAEQAATAAAPLHAELAQLKRFRHAFERFSDLRPGLLDLPDADTLVCRCEGITRGELDRALDRGICDLPSLKMATRIGMGDCQGKMCGSFCREYLMHKKQLASEQAGDLKPRFPLAPVPFTALAAEDTHE